MLPRFYIEQHLTKNVLITLSTDVVQHMWVLRLKPQQNIILFNGNGYAYQGIIHSLDKHHGVVQIMQQLPDEVQHNMQIDLALCIINNNKMDIALQNSVELGVTSITPVISNFSQRISRERLNTRLEHWKKVIISSCQQSGNNTLPILHLPQTFNDVIVQNYVGIKLIMLPRMMQPITKPANINYTAIKLLIGPEGGFSTNEIDSAQSNGFNMIKLGKLILRSETAVSASLSYINLTYGQWN